MTEGNPVPVNLPAKFAALYSYRDPDGNEYARTYRYPDRCPDRKADPYCFDGKAWVNRAPKKRLPYRIQTLNGDGRTVLIVEGEKCADAAACKLKDLDVLSWMGGSNAVQKTDWSRLEGRDVISWLDADHPGAQVTWSMLKELQAVGVASYSIILPEADRSPSWDCADAIEKEGWDVKRIESYLQDRKRKRLVWMRSEEADTILTQLKGFVEGTPARDLLPTMGQLAAAVHDEPEVFQLAVRDDALKIGKNLKLALSAKTLDASFSEFSKKRKALQDELDTAFPKPTRVEPPPVHQDPVDGVVLADELLDIDKRFLWLKHQEDYVLKVLWALWTWFVDGAECCPLLGFVSPEMQCGKTRALELLHRAVKNPLATSNISPAALFRGIDVGDPNLRKTLLIDEADASLFGVKKSEKSEDLRSILNAGHTQEFAFVMRAPREGGDGEENKRFSVWGPKAYASIGKVPETVRSRSITIRMRRKPKNAKIERWRASRDPVGDDWKERAERFAQEKMSEFRQADVDPKELSFLNDREEDNCRELVKVADLVGGDWPQRARQAVRSMKTRSKKQPEDDNTGNLLLADLWVLYKVKQESAKERGESPPDRILSKDLDEYLHKLEERPWGNWGKNGDLISPTARGRLLNKYEIHSGDFRDGPERGKGYLWEWFFPAWESYLEDDSDDVSKPNEHIPPPSTRDPVTYDKKQGVVSVSTRDMDGSASRVEDRASPCKQKDVTVSRVKTPPKSDSSVKNTCDEDQEAFDERAGILEHEGGMIRKEAEARAREDVRSRP